MFVDSKLKKHSEVKPSKLNESQAGEAAVRTGKSEQVEEVGVASAVCAGRTEGFLQE